MSMTDRIGAGDWTGSDDGEGTLSMLVSLALREDVGVADWTTLWTVPADRKGSAVVVAKAPLVLAGVEAALRVFRAVDPALSVDAPLADGTVCAPGTVVLALEGSARSILTAERTALNFLGRLSGIASVTRLHVEAVSGTRARVVDTRKTTPGWRQLEKAAVRAGGGENHRSGLYDMVLVKDNHIVAAGGIRAALEAVAARNRAGLPVEVEVTDDAELEEALSVHPRPDRILLDNMTLDGLRRAVERVRGGPPPRPLLEASGNVSLASIRGVAATGVDLISVGALTHSAPSADLSLRMVDG
jgi:nicotinate-nucleotide pyrophosphorylase (carboxylating)